MFRMLLKKIARWLRPENGKPSPLRTLGTRLLWSPLLERRVSSVRICRPCRHLTVDEHKYHARFSRDMFPVWSLLMMNRWGFRRVGYVGDCRYFRFPVPNWFGAWLRPIVTRNNTRDGWWFGNERTSDWYRYRDVLVNEEREEREERERA